MSKTYFISGIDTDAGKSYCTGWWAKQMAVLGQKVITQKFIQTGNLEFSEDIDLHRRLMGIDMLPEDIDHTTAPVIFSYPCSPHLAARIDGKEIKLSIIDDATQRTWIYKSYNIVIRSNQTTRHTTTLHPLQPTFRHR